LARKPLFVRRSFMRRRASTKAELRLNAAGAISNDLQLVNQSSTKAELRPATRHGAMTGGAGGVPLRSNTKEEMNEVNHPLHTVALA
jgi:hypothetical protein